MCFSLAPRQLSLDHIVHFEIIVQTSNASKSPDDQGKQQKLFGTLDMWTRETNTSFLDIPSSLVDHYMSRAQPPNENHHIPG